MIHSGLLGRKSEVLAYANLQTKFCAVQYFLWPLLFWIGITPLPSFVSFCDPSSDRACAALIDDFCKIAVQDVMESSGPVYPQFEAQFYTDCKVDLNIAFNKYLCFYFLTESSWLQTSFQKKHQFYRAFFLRNCIEVFDNLKCRWAVCALECDP